MRKRYALCVGNNYPGTSVQLEGCVNDASDWRDLLLKNGYAVHVLLEATKVDVLDTLSRLVSKARLGDRVVFTYSGHGSWVPDCDLATGRNKALVMAGLNAEDLLVDQELHGIFSQLPLGARGLILTDTCHSGTITSRRTSQAEGRPKFISPVDLEIPLSFERVIQLEGRRRANTPKRAASVLSACADNENAFDATFSGRANGAFTRVAIDAHMRGINLGHWFSAVRQVLPSERYPQTPLLTTTTRRKYSPAL